MYILGISCFYHDSAAALLRDGELVAAAMEERFSRRKHDNTFPKQAIDFCLQQAGITGRDLDYAVFYEKPLVKFERILLTTLGTFPRSSDVWREAMLNWLKEKLWVKSIIQREVGINLDRILFCDHHMSHAASAFFASPFKEAAVMTVDGVGEWTTTTLGRATSVWADGSGGDRNDITLFEEQRFPHSLGLLYSAFTAFLGFRVNNGEYKVMGMAPYGEPRYVDKVYKVFHQDSPDGSFQLNLDYFSFQHSTQHTFNQKFIDLFGPPRKDSDDFFTPKTHPERARQDTANAQRNQHYADIAASVQLVLEETLIKIANYLYHKTKLPKLVMAGGVALNTKANYRLLQETPFDEIYIQPAAGDDGGALGAALWAWHIVLGKPRQWVMPHAYWGKAWSDAETRAFLDSRGIPYEAFDDNNDKLIEAVVDGLVNRKVIGFYQGRFEWGPRALGNRSILADPRSSEMKEVVNTKIKFREPFRPFAPVILRECAPDYFDYPGVDQHEAPRYMLMVSPIKADKQDKIQAVCHEGTGRLQAIERDTNPRYYDVVAGFGQATGVPVVLNTSFNLRGEPIVTSPEDAFNTFNNSHIDMLVLNSFLVRKPE
ncbi:MAG TPA: carbamoyltransferase [Spirillospora sp.]|nr:carbamoyltransferase [Spirillospora sp.]